MKLVNLIVPVVAVILIFRSNPALAAETGSNRVFYAGASVQFPDDPVPSLLARELIRQAVLMAARDDLGLETRDQAMGEWDGSSKRAPEDSAGGPIRLDVHSGAPAYDHLELTCTCEGRPAQHILIPAQYKIQDWLDIAALSAAAQAASDGVDLKMLQSMGYAGTANKPGTEDVSDQIKQLLNQTTLLAPVSALQQTYATIRTSGESPACLNALVRAYANLGQLTRFQWSTINKVMAARSILYAQKMVARDPKSKLALYSRAYAFAMTGLHQAALDDVNAAAKLGGSDPIPAWAELIEPLCRYDVAKLQSMVDTDNERAPLAALCCFIDVENCGFYSRVSAVGQAMLQHNPACFRIIDGLSEEAGVSALHGLTESMFPTMLQTLRSDIQRLPEFPATVSAAFRAAAMSDDHVHNLAMVSAAFETATERAEPSYVLAGRIIQETNFAHVVRRAVFLADKYGDGAGDYVSQALPLVEGHRFERYIKSLAHPYAARGPLLADMEINDAQFQMYNMVYCIRRQPVLPGKMTGQAVYDRMFRNSDESAYDQERLFYPFTTKKPNDWNLDEARHVLLYSPYSGVALSQMVMNDWKNSKPHAEQWAKDFADQPVVLSAIGSAYVGDAELDKAESVFLNCVEIAPDRPVLEKLANIYLSKGDEAQWEATLLQVKDHPDLALDHSKVDQEIAQHYMNTGKYEKARKFADLSAEESGASWAISTSAIADEYCGDYVAAEKQMRDVSERYGGVAWFFWCKRTGKGDLKTATASADSWVDTQISEHISDYDDTLGLIFYLENQPAKAREYLERSMNTHNEAWAGLMASCICLQLKDNAGRTKDLQYVADHCKNNSAGENYAVEAELAKAELAAGEKSLTDDELEKLSKGCNQYKLANLNYFSGRVCELNGESDKARSRYQAITRLNQATNLWSFMLACEGLHQMGIADTPLPKVVPK